MNLSGLTAFVRMHVLGLLCLMTFICSSYTARAQVQAAFSASPASGCAPLVVQFTDLSTGNPVSWKWNLGNGNTSTLQNPSSAYFAPGSYTITLVATDAAGRADSITKTQYISVYGNPIAAFVASDTTGCVPLSVGFTDQSSASGATISQWKWDFGDGNTSASQNPSHTYTAAGPFNVTLQVVSNYGCIGTGTKANYINVSPTVSAAFSGTPRFSCSSPATVAFASTTSGAVPVGYQWNFGDGTTSGSSAPNHVYTAPGSFTVTMIAQSAAGCADTVSQPAYINIGNLQPAFSISAPAGCVNRPLSFQNTTVSSMDSVLWRFGDGVTSKSANPVHTYTQAGTYTVTLIGYSSVCSDSVSQTLSVTVPPAGAFSADKTTGCSVPFTANFTYTASAGAATVYSWDFGDGTTSALASPSHTYTGYGSFPVKLIVTNAGGCADTIVQPAYIKLAAPAIQLKGLPVQGCIPYTINPTATVSSSDPVTGYQWNFGDGTTSTLPAPSHIYTAQGTYTVTLTVTTASGCTATSVDTGAVEVGTRPNTAFIAAPAISCVGKVIQFTDQTPKPVDSWAWYLTDNGSVTSTAQNPAYAYGDTGTYTIMLVAGNNGCLDSATRLAYIKIEPPAARFLTESNCSSRLTRTFVDQSVAATSWLWDFGDGTTSTQESPQHTYATPGKYTVTLTVTNGTCTQASTQQVFLIKADPGFRVYGSPVCKGSPVSFVLPNLADTTVQAVVWTFGDGTTLTNTTQTIAQHTYTADGSFTVGVTVTDVNGCDTSMTIPNAVLVTGPTAAFTPSTLQVCAGTALTLTDQSTSDGTHPIVSSTWNFGDGPPDSTLTPPYTHTYTQGGSENIVLSVRDAGGCTDTAQAGIIVSDPLAYFTVADTAVCAGQPVSFTNGSTGGVAPEVYTWAFGDGGTASTTGPGVGTTHVYTRAGQDTVTLSVKDGFGCTASQTRPAYITVQVPIAAFSASGKVSYCPPLDVQFTNQSSGYASVAWNFGDGNTSTEINPLHFYSYPGVYIATLTVSGAGGCTATAADTITIHGPTGTFTYTPTVGCDSLQVHFSVASDSSVAFIWDYGNGQTLSIPQNTTTYTYTDTGTYIPRIILISGTGCQVPITGSQAIHVYRVVAGLKMSASRACGSGIIQFQDSSVSNDQLSAFSWNFGDQSSSTEQNPFHAYTQPGIYTVTHSVFTANGCSDTIVLTDTIRVFQPPVVQIKGDSAGCVPDTLSFTALVVTGNADSLQWQWNLGNGQTANAQTPPPAAYETAGNYTLSLIVADDNGCTDSTSETVIIHPLPVVSAGGPYILCLGTPVTLNASGADNYAWMPGQYLSCANCANPQANPPASMEYYLTGYTLYGCSSRDSAFINVFFPDTVKVNGDTALCLGGYYRMVAQGAYSYSWSPSVGLTDPESASTYATPPATTTYTVTGTDSAHCFTDSKSITITVYPVPTVDAGPDVTGSAGSPAPIQITNSGDVVSWSWSPPNGLSCDTCPDPMAGPVSSTLYTVTVKNAAGCTAQDTMTVFITCNNGNIFLPNTFSPNGDGMNDVFYPRGKGISLVKSLRIFNRWGQMIFERDNFPVNDRSAGWDGTYGGQKLSPDAYVYLCEVICENNEVIQLKGDVTLLR
jgi:gliding motility-associated-like protein